MFPVSKTWGKVSFVSLSLTSLLANISLHVPYIKSNRLEHVFLITVGDVLEGAVGFVAALRLSDN